MSMLAIKLLVDSLMIILLITTIIYCVIVSRRIRVLQDSREEFAQLITKFDATTKKAQDTIDDMKKISQRVTESLNERLDKANFLADDLAFMIEKGNKVADKVEGKMPKTTEKSALSPKREPLLGRGSSKKTDEEPKAKKRGKVESMLERLSEKDAPKPRRRASSRVRSRAEKELQDAIKTGDE